MSPLQKVKLKTIVFSTLLFLCLCGYVFWQYQTLNRNLINKTTADTAVILLGLSFALSGLSYFLGGFFTQALKYRKYLGLSGFALAGTHALGVLLLRQDRFPIPGYYLTLEGYTIFIFGLTALLIFAMVTVVSTKKMIIRLGTTRWRELMRVGYLAYVLVIAHFAVTQNREWLLWLQTQPLTSPPLSLAMFLFGSAVIFLRVALALALRSAKKASPL